MKKSGNMILLGAASKALGLDITLLENAVATVFASKGEEVVEMNKKALAIGVENSK
jgi:indolepyruvate ferredoxin oxidoreductase beta subunit